MRLLVASEAHSAVLEQLVANHVAKGVVLVKHGHSPLMSLPTVLLIGDAKELNGNNAYCSMTASM